MTWDEDVRRRGFGVLPAFLDDAELATLADAYRSVATDGEKLNPNYNIRFLLPAVRKTFAKKIIRTAKLASDPARPMDWVYTGIFYPTRDGIDFDWHTDSTSQYMYPHYLNFWIPIAKPRRDHSGLRVVDFEALGARHPELATHFIGHGSTRVTVKGGKTIFYDADQLRVIEIENPALLDEVSVAPELAPGDLLAMRSDVFHRTQDVDDDRLAISFRVIPTTMMIARSTITAMGSTKFNNMARMRMHFARRLATFEVARRPELTIGEYTQLYYSIEEREVARCAELGQEFLNNSQFEDLVYELGNEHAKR